MATMRDVASLAQVSLATVSFVVNNTKPVRPATRARVEQAMVELGFRRNPHARALATKRSRLIALLFPVLQHRLSGTAELFFAGAAQAASELGYTLVLWPVDNDTDRLSDLTFEQLIDGVILMEVELDDGRVEQLQRANTPFALIGRTRDPSSLSYVDVDFERMVSESIDHLVGLGHREIDLVLSKQTSGNSRGYGPSARTKQTFLDQMQRLELPHQVHHCDDTPRGGRLFAASLVEESPSTTALLVMTENAVVGMVNEFAVTDIEVPRDLSIILIGSTPEIAAMTEPELAVMISPAHQLGRMGVEALIERLENESAALRQERVMGTFTLGESLGPPRSNALLRARARRQRVEADEAQPGRPETSRSDAR